MNFLTRFLSRHCRLLTFITLISLIIPLAQLPKGRINNNVEMWLSPEKPAFQSYRSFLERYGTEQFIILATQWTDPLSDSALDSQLKLAGEIKNIPAVQNVFDFASIAKKIEASQYIYSDIFKSLFSSTNTTAASSIPDNMRFSTSPVKVIFKTFKAFTAIARTRSTLHTLNISTDDAADIADNIALAYKALVSETSNCYQTITKSSVNSSFLVFPIQLYVNIAHSYGNISSEFSRLEIGDYTRFFGFNRPDWRTFIRNEPLLHNFIIGSDNQTVGMLITLNNSKPLPETIDAIYSAINSSGLPDNKVFLAGTPVINLELDRGSRSVSARFLPLAIAIGGASLFIIIHNLIGCIAIAITLISSMIWTVGLLFLTGRSLNMVTITLPALLISLALAGNIHIVTHYLALLARGASRTHAIRLTIQTMLFPVFMTCLTTAVGFASIMISDIMPIQDFGLFAALGILISGLFNFTLLPGLLSYVRTIAPTRQYNTKHWSQLFLRLLPLPRTIIVFSVIILSAGIYFTFKVKANSDTVSFLPTDSRVARDYHAIMNDLTGLYSLEIDINTSDENKKQTADILESLADKFEANTLIAKAIYPGQFKPFIKRLGLPAIAALYFDPANRQFSSMLNRYHSYDSFGNHWRISLFCRAQGTEQYRQLQHQVENDLEVLKPFADYTITGLIPLLNDSQSAIVYTQIRSFSIAIVIILLLIGIFMRSFKAMLAAILPNALPIFTLFSFMALANIPLDTATVMIAGIATGIAADDTIHLLACYRIQRKHNKSAKEAFFATFDQTARSITWTSIIAASGFAILLFAPFKPLQYFGLLGSLTMLTAWLSDIIVLPACITLLKLWEPEPKYPRTN